jgi:hypothetical protein
VLNSVNAFPPKTSAAGSHSIQRIDPTQTPNWDEHIQNLGGSVFHSAAWARVLKRAYGYRPQYFTLRDQTATIHSVLPTMEVNSWATGRRGVSLPFTDECAPTGDSFRSLFEAALEYGRTRRWKYFECRGTEPPVEGATPSLLFFGHRLDLKHTEAQLLAGIESSGRRAIRKAQESGVTVDFADDASAMRSFYTLVCTTRKRHGLPPQPRDFYDYIQQEVLSGGKGAVAIARYQSTPVAGAVYLHSSTSVLYKFGASDESFQQYRANNLVMWEAIRRYSAAGFAHLDFGRTSVANSGLRKFKLGWGTQEYPVSYFKFDFSLNAFVTDADRSSGWHSRIFGSLPGPLARVAGELLYKHIA